MPPKKARVPKKIVEEEEEENLKQIDVQYNPDIVSNLLKDLESANENKIAQIQKDAEFMITSMQQAFHLELIKIPNNVKQMSIKRFGDEFGFSIEAVTRGAILGTNNKSSANSNNSNNKVFQTPAPRKPASHLVAQTPGARVPREGETILSVNGSPLGEFNTVKKAPKSGSTIIPATPGVFVPLKTGEVVDIEEIDVENMPEEMKHEAIDKMKVMMDNMKLMMEKLQSKI